MIVALITAPQGERDVGGGGNVAPFQTSRSVRFRHQRHAVGVNDQQFVLQRDALYLHPA
jgi:hypothetical protein